MKTIFGALALCGIAFALSGNAAAQTIIGEWQPVKTFCEGSKVLSNSFRTNDREIFNKVSKTRIMDIATEETNNCALHIKTNLSIIENQYKTGPFLELTSPNCPKVSKWLQKLMKYSKSHLKNNENLGSTNNARKSMIRLIEGMQRVKEGNSPTVEFKINDDNRRLWTFSSIEESKDICHGSRFGREYKRIE